MQFNKKFGLLDAFLYSLMVGAGEAFFVAYALELGYPQLKAAILVTVPIVIGGILQLLSSYGINKVKSFKKWTVVGVFLQALIFLTLIFFQEQLKTSYSLFLLIITIYWSFSLGITPSWNSWISKLLKDDEIRSFFSSRNIFLAVGTLLGLLLAGLTLHYAPDEIFGMRKFNFIFVLCFLFRFFSFLSLLKQPDVHFEKVPNRVVSNVPEKVFLKEFIRYSALFKLGVYFSASFFAPYMLKQLNLSYLQFTLILSNAFLGRMILTYFIKKKIHLFDINLIQLLSSIGISIIPLFWIFLRSFEQIIFLEIFTGILWGSFEVAFFIICFEEIPKNQQAQVMSRYNFLHTLAIGIGSLSGLWLFSFFEAKASTYHLIFLISAGLRLLTLFSFPRKKIYLKKVLPFISMRLLAVRPNVGSITKPMWQLFKKKD